MSDGIIPACAGSTNYFWICPLTCGDHPRMRGEHMSDILTDSVPEGSSPHARGALGDEVAACCEMGIIPACAGSTGDAHDVALIIGDHPRMRGEHASAASWLRVMSGSSPHARGAPYRGTEKPLARGIIPACAGSTPWRRRPSSAARDHPRMRGEHTYLQREQHPDQGSSPHARGAPLFVFHGFLLDGIIPACAGSTA